MMAKRVPIDTYCEKKIPTLQKTYDGLIDYVDISSVDNTEKKIISYQTIESTDAPSRAKQLLKQGDVLVSTVRPNLNAVAVVEEETENLMVGSTGYCVLRCKDNMDVRYLFNFCQSQYFVDDMSSQATGASYPAVSNGIVRSSLIPCYSIEEQQKIAEKLDTVSELLALRKQQLAELDELVKSRFIELFGDPITNSNNLPTERMELRFNLKAGITTAADDIHEFEEGMYEIPCYGGNGIRGYVREKSYTGNYPIIGRQGALCGNVQYATGEFHATEHAVLVSLLKNDNSVWVYHLLKLMDLFRYHTGAAQPGLAVKTLNTVEVIVADKKKQDQFAAFVEQTDKSKLTIQQSLDKLELLKKSLMQEYFG